MGVKWVREGVRWGVIFYSFYFYIIFYYFFYLKKKSVSAGVRWVLNGSGRVSGGVFLIFLFFN